MGSIREDLADMLKVNTLLRMVVFASRKMDFEVVDHLSQRPLPDCPRPFDKNVLNIILDLIQYQFIDVSARSLRLRLSISHDENGPK